MMAEEFTSDLVKQLRENNYVLERNNVVIKLAKSYGFCWGVDRAVALAYEARKFYKDDKIHITNEIIHNPSVNTRLRQMDINFIGLKDGEKDFSDVKKGDVVILPAFGASLPEMQVPPPPPPSAPPCRASLRPAHGRSSSTPRASRSSTRPARG